MRDPLGRPTGPTPEGTPQTILFTYDPDLDHDGIPTWRDFCPTVFNSSAGPSNLNQDYDCDGIGDECDKCPNDPLNDEDHDGVCGDVDNCPRVANSTQANCNHESEIERHSAVIGDACDPVPCPVVTAPGVQRTLRCGRGIVFDLCDVRTTRGTLQVDPIGAHSLTTTSIQDPPPEVTIRDVPTSYRFCQIDPMRHLCTDNEIDEALLEEVASVAGERPEHAWHRITVDNATSTGVRGVGEVWDYPSIFSQFPGLNFRPWQFDSDYDFWRANNVVMLDDRGTYGQASLNGRIWSHGKTGAGSDFPPAPDYGIHAPKLVNHYFDIAPDAVARKLTLRRVTIQRPLRILWPLCPACVPGSWWTFGQPETLILVPAEGEWVALRATRRSPVVTTSFGPHLLASLNNPAVSWVNAAEPSFNVAPSTRPIAVGLVDSGLHVAETVSVARRQGSLALLGRQDISDVVPRTEEGSPPPRDDFHEVYSRATDMLYLIGGRDPQTRAPTGEIWYRPRAEDGWVQAITPGYQPRDVLAATFSYVDDRLYILDHSVTNDADVARLASVDPINRSAQIIATWTRRGNVDRQWLVTDHDGGILLVNSSSSKRRYGLFKIVADGSHRAGDACRRDRGDLIDGGLPDAFGKLVRAGRRDLLMAPAADDFGYTLVLRKNRRSVEAVIQRLSLSHPGHVGCGFDCDEDDDFRD